MQLKMKPKEAKEYFDEIEQKLIKYTWENTGNYTEDLTDSVESNSSSKSTSSTKSRRRRKRRNDFEATIDVDSDDETTESIRLAFEKKRSDDRKQWLLDYNKNNILNNDQKIVPISDFIHKELIHFSNDDLSRSIPSICDGLKISTRKILYGCIYNINKYITLKYYHYEYLEIYVLKIISKTDYFHI